MITKRLKIVLLITIAMSVLLISQASASRNYFQEPKENIGKVPAHLVWNPETGGYYDPSEVEWDSASQRYIDKFIDHADVDLSELSYGTSEEEWVEENKNSNNKLYQTLISYYEYYRKNPGQLIFSRYEPERDIPLKYLIELGPEYVPDMIKEMENGSPWAGLLTYAVDMIMNWHIPPSYFDASKEGIIKWVDYVKSNYYQNGKLILSP